LSFSQLACGKIAVLHVCGRLTQIAVIGPSHPRFEHLQTGVSVLYVHHGDQSTVAIYRVWFQLNLPDREIVTALDLRDRLELLIERT
jgi:hypothetical protein